MNLAELLRRFPIDGCCCSVFSNSLAICHQRVVDILAVERERFAKMANDRARALQNSDRVEIFAENQLFHLADDIRTSLLPGQKKES